MKNLFSLLILALLVFSACETPEPIMEEPLPEEKAPMEEPTSEEPEEETPSETKFIEFYDGADFGDVKPVIYLYPEADTELTVELDYLGRITTEYPESENGVWTVTAQPDGTLTYKDREYNYLFWEGVSPLYQNFTFQDGFVVARADYIHFLEEKLTILGLSETEQADFISYWLPQMQKYEFIQLRFLFEEYERLATLTITPKPDQMIRVFAMVKGLHQSVSLPEQKLESKTRHGFTVVEWGGRFIQ